MDEYLPIVFIFNEVGQLKRFIVEDIENVEGHISLPSTISLTLR